MSFHLPGEKRDKNTPSPKALEEKKRYKAQRKLRKTSRFSRFPTPTTYPCQKGGPGLKTRPTKETKKSQRLPKTLQANTNSFFQAPLPVWMREAG